MWSSIVFVFTIFCSFVIAKPQTDSGHFHEVVKKAHNMQLLPQEAVVDKTAPGIQVAYYDIKPFERVDLNSAFGDSIPADIVQSLESQIDAVGYEGYKFPQQSMSVNVPKIVQYAPQPQYHQNERIRETAHNYFGRYNNLPKQFQSHHYQTPGGYYYSPIPMFTANPYY